MHKLQVVNRNRMLWAATLVPIVFFYWLRRQLTLPIQLQLFGSDGDLKSFTNKIQSVSRNTSSLIQVHFVSLVRSFLHFNWCQTFNTCNSYSSFFLLLLFGSTSHKLRPMIDDQWLESSASYLLLIRKVFSSLCLHIASHRHVHPRCRLMFVCLARWRQL